MKSQELLEQYGEKESDRLSAMRPAVEGMLGRLIGGGSDALLVPAGAGWAWGRDLPAAAWLLKVRTPDVLFIGIGGPVLEFGLVIALVGHRTQAEGQGLLGLLLGAWTPDDLCLASG